MHPTLRSRVLEPLAGLLLVAALLLLSPRPAAANLIFDWTGTCLTGCTGLATLHIEVSDTYVPGTAVGSGTPLFAATYTDSVGPPFSLEAIGAHDIFELLVPATPGGLSRFADQTDFFRSFADGTWRFETEHTFGPCQLPDCGHTATGIASQWIARPAAVPWTANLALLGLGAGLLLVAVTRGRAA